jgi:carboxypeptidase Taq
MQNKLEQLKSILGEVSDLSSSASLLHWDMQCYMPPGGGMARGYQISTLERLAHERFTAAEVGRLLDALEKETGSLDPDSAEARLVKVTRRMYDLKTRVPGEWVAKYSQITSESHGVWAEARAKDDFASFQPYLEKIVDLRREYAGFFQPYEHVYDPLLDEYEPGMKTNEVLGIFSAIRPQQVALIQSIASAPQVDASFLHQEFDAQKQWDFGVEVISRFGYDWKRGRQDKAAHPFTININTNDVRITTRIQPDYLGSALFSTLHECGHAFYEMGVNQDFQRTPLGNGASLALHESQSRLWENLVGRSLEFWEHFYPRLQEYFPTQLDKVALEDFYRGINRVEPSLIRVEADEATYNLHIMLRLELEIALMEGSLEVKDLPEVWNGRVQEYLGITPPNNRLGVLQDVHWSSGLLGYFSTYALGNLISAQLWEVLQREIPDLKEQIRCGEFEALLGWLGQNIHQYGTMFEPKELVQRITGGPIDPQPYLRYLNDKYSRVYGL